MTAAEYVKFVGRPNIKFDHIEKQKSSPFYCGTVFCGHSTKVEAEKCWEQRNAAFNTKYDEMISLISAGKQEEADKFLYDAGFVESPVRVWG